jgi:hypothetical protein
LCGSVLTANGGCRIGGEISPLISLYQILQTKDLYTPKELEDPSLFYIEDENPYEDFGGQEYITTYKVDEIQTTKEIYETTK